MDTGIEDNVVIIEFEFDINQRYVILTIQLWGTKIDTALFQSSLMLRKVDNLLKLRSRRNKILRVF